MSRSEGRYIIHIIHGAKVCTRLSKTGIPYAWIAEEQIEKFECVNEIRAFMDRENIVTTENKDRPTVRFYAKHIDELIGILKS